MTFRLLAFALLALLLQGCVTPPMLYRPKLPEGLRGYEHQKP